MSNDLPLVQSPTYLLDKDKPKSLQNIKIFHRVHQGLITSNENRKDIEYRDFDKAIMEWKDDLEYLENKWMNNNLILFYERHEDLLHSNYFLILKPCSSKILTNLSSCCSLGRSKIIINFLND